jgi:two-component system KDP operon response regulator KdpE
MTIDILVVDDDPGVRGVLRRFLSEKGYSVATAEDGETALRMIRESAPDVLLIDVYLPGISGIDVLYTLEHEGRGVPTLAFSGMPDDEMARETMLMGADDFILKPFDFGALEASLLPKLAAMGFPSPS